jgi:hypothetical protein
MPAAVTLKGSLVALTPSGMPGSTGVVDEKTSTVHAASLNSRNVTVPLGAAPPMMVALSRTVLLIRATGGLASVVITGVATAAAWTGAGAAAVCGPAEARSGPVRRVRPRRTTANSTNRRERQE